MKSIYPLSIVLFLSIIFCGCSVTKTQHTPAEVKMANGIPTLFVDNKPYPPFAYLSYLGEKQFYDDIATTDIHLYNFPVYFGDRGINSTSGIKPFRKHFWTGREQYDYSSIIEDFEALLSADPEAKVILRIHVDPPVWWEKENPDAVCLLPDGTSFRTSFYSSKWQKETGEVLKHCLSWLMDSPFSKHFIGVHIAGGSTEEWFYHFKKYFYDENPERTTKFRQWLKQKYVHVDDLRKAWHQPQVDFETAQPADISGKDTKLIWLNTIDDQPRFDTFDFHAETLVDHIIFFCKIIKDTSKRTLLAGAFNGYHYFVPDPRRGHGALAKLLQCDDLDFLSSPNDYNRIVGEDWPPMSAIQSIQKHGKLWLAENDTRTSITTMLRERAPHIAPENSSYDGGVWIGPSDMETSISFLWKNLARMFAYGYGGWWFDMWGGWFSDPQLLEVLRKGQELFYQYPDKEIPAMKPEVCVVVDERLQLWDESLGGLTGQIIYNRYALAKTGAPYDLFLRTDLNTISAEKYKVVWLMGIPDITSQENNLIDQLQKKGITVLLTDTIGTTVTSKSAKKYIDGKLQWDAKELGDLWRESGVHQYIETQDVLYAGRGWVGIHTTDGGRKNVILPFKAKVINAVNNTVINSSTNSFQLEMAPKSTILLKLIEE